MEFLLKVLTNFAIKAGIIIVILLLYIFLLSFLFWCDSALLDFVKSLEWTGFAHIVMGVGFGVVAAISALLVLIASVVMGYVTCLTLRKEFY